MKLCGHGIIAYLEVYFERDGEPAGRIDQRP